MSLWQEDSWAEFWSLPIQKRYESTIGGLTKKVGPSDAFDALDRHQQLGTRARHVVPFTIYGKRRPFVYNGAMVVTFSGQQISKSVTHTAKIAYVFLKNIKPNKNGATVVGLSGDLGSGKTTFTKEVANILGIKKDLVTSPTFVIEKIYKISHPDFSHLIHIDAYRLEKSEELVKLGWDEIIKDSKNLILLEWPERVKDILPKETKMVYFEFIDEETRRIKIPEN